jgi:hypothetical protein
MDMVVNPDDTSIRLDEATPNGGAYSISYFLDEEGEPVAFKDAVLVRVSEYSEADQVVFSTTLRLAVDRESAGPEFKESQDGVRKVAPSEFPNLIEIVNETYLDQVESILDARIEANGDILVVAQDGPKTLAVKITGTEILIRLVNPDEIDPDGSQEPQEGGSDLPINTSVPEEESVAFTERTATADPIDLMVVQLQDVAQPEIAAMIDSLREELAGAETLEEFQARLVSLYPELDSGPLVEVLSEALLAARMAGVYDVQQEIGGDA